METIDCRCSSCQNALGTTVNLWTQIGRSYYSPVASPHPRLSVQACGAARAGEKGTLVEGCRLQDIECHLCNAVVGIECLAVPTNHALDNNQVLLRKTAFSAVGQGGKVVDLNVVQKLRLRYSERRSEESDAEAEYGRVDGWTVDPEIMVIQEQIETQRADIDRIDSAGLQVVAAMDAAISRMGSEVTGFQETMRKLQQDLGGHQGGLSQVQAQASMLTDALHDTQKRFDIATSQLRKSVGTVKTEIRQLKEQLKSVTKAMPQDSDRNTAVIEKQGREIESLRSELAGFGRQMQRHQQERTAGSVAHGVPAFGSRELDIITESITRLSGRASQVEPLQMELVILKGRVQRLESLSWKEAEEESLQTDEPLSTTQQGLSTASQRKRRQTGTGPPSKRSSRRQPASPTRYRGQED
ncbi:hypothetical protein CMQ_7896 [Grosmannia clavigera kw1407]|uniref:Uncharacterized protein n=1 Tax=Grosmannia clavigera (strain kw1407 / UAMH 11150) TaxID=655863 RepID=F0XRP1_GROCL|nr:uncharacterized protein CMQ_7896 [Grosmannia clavigera kw1407]EFW99528.1 hypothetical protein CMQ_7896 [Grosmannia clavigera kw1407]